jgi:hypothetical protein
VQTATNPQTGEKVQWNGSSWVPVGGAPAAPRPVVVGTPNPYKVQSNQQDLTKGNLDIEGKRLDIQTKQLDLQGKQLDLQKGDADAKLQEGERTAAALATRIQGSAADIANALRGNPAAVKPTVIGEVAGILGEAPKDLVNSSARRTVEDAQLDILDAALTLGTGAAYTREQIEGYRESYFPSLTDDPQNIAVKQQRLLRILEAAKLKAGGAAPMIDQAIAAVGGSLSPDAASAGAAAGDVAGQAIGQPRAPLSDEQKQQFFSILESQGPEAATAYLGQFGFAPKDPASLSQPHAQQIEYPAVNRLAEGIGGVVEGVGDVLGMVSNPIYAGINALTGSNFNPDMGENMREGLGLPAASTPSQSIVNAAGGAALMGGGFAGAARMAAPYVSGAANAASSTFGEAVGKGLQSFGAMPGADMAISGVSGASAEAAGQAGGGQAAQLIAALLGGGAAAPGILRASGAMTRPSGPVGNALTRAGEAENVTVNRAMADRDSQQKVTALGRSMVGGNIMNRDMAKVAGQIEGRVQSLGGNGQALNEPAAVGKTIQGVGKRYIQTSGAEFKGRYTALKAKAGGVPIAPSESVSHIDAILGELGKLPRQNAKEIKYLEDIKADIANGIDVESARSIGSRLSKDISKGEVMFGPAERNVLDIRKALARDTEAGLTAAGKANTAARYRDLDAAYSQRMDFIRQKLQGLLGKRNAPLDPEKAAGRLKTMAGERGDAAGLYQILNKATPEERADIAATFANDLGKGNDGQFSVANFVSDIEKIPASARVALWGKEGAKTLDNLTLLGNEHKRVTKAMGGSPTAVASDYKGYLINFLFGGGLGMVQGGLSSAAALAGVGVAAKAGRDIVNARILMNKDVVNWLRTAPRTTDPKAINAHHARLKAIAARQPAIAGDIQQIEQAMLRAANENVSPSVAASEPEQDR